MKKLYLVKSTLVILISSILFIACDKTDPLPMSQANFKITSVSPEIDVPVQFENLSLNTSAVSWDFGDGLKDSLTLDPKHTYEEPGTYSVKMTAYTNDGQKSEAIKDVEVGQRYLTSMSLLNINMLDEEGNPWDDDGSGPDVLYQLGPTDATTLDELVFVLLDSLNVGQIRTPVSITTDNFIPDDYELLNKDYFVLLEDVDTVADVTEFQFMASVEFNPVVPEDDFITVTKREDGTGDIVIPFVVIQEYQFFLEFEIR